MFALRLVPPMGAPIEIASDRTLIGRDPTADIVVNDPSVSRRHAIIERRPEGWAIFDQRSANGTWLENQRIEQALLVSGQQLRLGAVTFAVILAAPGAAARPAPAAAPPRRPPTPVPRLRRLRCRRRPPSTPIRRRPRRRRDRRPTRRSPRPRPPLRHAPPPTSRLRPPPPRPLALPLRRLRPAG